MTNTWNKREVEMLKRNYPNKTYAQLANMATFKSRTLKAIRRKAERMGITRS